MREGLQRGDLSADSLTQSNEGLTVQATMENREDWVKGMLRKREGPAGLRMDQVWGKRADEEATGRNPSYKHG